MKIIKELDQSERATLKEIHRSHRLFSTHIKTVLDQPSCFKVSIFPEDFDQILIHSGISHLVNYQTLSTVITYIKKNPAFLDNPAYLGVLEGQRVKYYLTKLKQVQEKLQDCFTGLGDCFMLDKSEALDRMRNEITDGMHRLVAYGLATDMDKSYFPIPTYFGTNKTSLTVETE